MADIKYINFKTAISYWKEAIREITGYQPEVDDGVERKALLNKEKTFLNKVMVAQECMKNSTDNKNQITSIFRNPFVNKEIHKLFKFFLS